MKEDNYLKETIVMNNLETLLGLMNPLLAVTTASVQGLKH